MDAHTFFETLDAFFNENKIKEAGEYLEKSLSEAREANDISLEISILNEMMGYYRSTDQEEKGIASVNDGLKLLQENGLDNHPSVATMWINMGTTLCHFESVKEAEICYQNAEISLSGQPQAALTMASLYNNTAAVYVKNGDFPEAEKRYELALDKLKEVEKVSQLWEDVLFNRLVTYLNILVMDQIKIHQKDTEDKEKTKEMLTNSDVEIKSIEEIHKDSDARLKMIKEILQNPRFKESSSYDYAIKKCKHCFENIGISKKAEWFERLIIH